jgi:hypothetical protein
VVSRRFLSRRVMIDGVKAFEFNGGSVDAFITRVKDTLSRKGYEDFVRMRLEGGELVVVFQWMGSSELRYRISETDTGFRADLSGERMSPLHGAFRQAFEDRFDKVVGSVGANVV